MTWKPDITVAAIIADADRFLIVLSDGEATDETWKPVVSELKKKNIRVISLAIGTVAYNLVRGRRSGGPSDGGTPSRRRGRR